MVSLNKTKYFSKHPGNPDDACPNPLFQPDLPRKWPVFGTKFGVSPPFPDAGIWAEFPISARGYFAARAALISLPAHDSRDERTCRAMHCRKA
ncbi:MAG: hypothetical protein CBHOC_0704 [uncultured Caballeronia sp.]|nr:MAG: hypothetical protein CBHOC_0704 [uncultured Caballeronia sp.]